MAPEAVPPPQSVDIETKNHIQGDLINRYMAKEVPKADIHGAVERWISIYSDGFEDILARIANTWGIEVVRAKYAQDPETFLSEIEEKLKAIKEK